MEKIEGSDDLSRFPLKFLTYILPALFKIATGRNCRGMRRKEMENIVRREVDMALVLSAQGFSWSRALKARLESEKKSDSVLLVDVLHELLDSASEDADCEPNDETKKAGEKEEVKHFIGNLRSILPGGEEMGMEELVSEVESYVACLKMQVTLLQSLLEAQIGNSCLA